MLHAFWPFSALFSSACHFFSSHFLSFLAFNLSQISSSPRFPQISAIYIQRHNWKSSCFVQASCHPVLVSFLFTSHLPPEVPHLCMDLLRVVLYLLCSELLLSWIWCLHSEHCSVLWCKIQQVSWNSLTCADMAWEGAEHLSRLFLGKGKAVAAQSSSKGSLCQLPPGTGAGAGAVEVSSLFGSLWEFFTGWKHTVCFERLILNFWSLLWDQNRSCGFLLSLQRHSCTFCFLSFLAGYSVGNFPVVLLQTTSDF